MYKVIRGSLYNSNDFIEFLTKAGIKDPAYVMECIRKRGRGIIRNIQILYVRY